MATTINTEKGIVTVSGIEQYLAFEASKAAVASERATKLRKKRKGQRVKQRIANDLKRRFAEVAKDEPELNSLDVKAKVLGIFSEEFSKLPRKVRHSQVSAAFSDQLSA